MKGTIPVVALTLSSLLGGCCAYVKPDEVSWYERSEFKPGPWCGIFSGYGAATEPERSRALYTPVSDYEYGEILCANRSPENYATCVNRVVDFCHNAKDDAAAEAGATSGPFAVALDGKLYYGTYRTDLFSGYFFVSNHGASCRGSYNILFGSKGPVFAVSCDNGRTGTAEIVRSRNGRDGIGYIEMTNGDKGRIVFGRPAAAANPRFMSKLP
jgi:hypothetical protein